MPSPISLSGHPRLFNGVRLVDWPSPRNVERLDLGCLPMILDMQHTGIRLDLAHFKHLEIRLTEEKRRLESEFQALAASEGCPDVEVGSPDQIAEFLFHKLRIQGDSRVKLTAKRRRETTGDEVLSGFISAHPVVKTVLDWREVDKLLNTYVIPIPASAVDGRFYTEIRPTVAITGRLATGDAREGKRNLQNIPIQGEWGKEIRNGFIAGPGRVIVSNDLSQIEMRIPAHLANCPALREVFVRGLDIHSFTAIRMFGLDGGRILALLALDARGQTTPEQKRDITEFKHKYRLPAKTLGFAILYGVTARGLQQQILAAGGPFWTEEECQGFIDAWFAVYPEVKEWLEEQYTRAKRYEMIWDMFGRWRAVPEVRSVHRRAIEKAMREVGNFPIQSGAQGVIKLAMAEGTELYRYYQGLGEVCLPLIQVHDEILTECSRAIAEEYAAVLRDIMRSVVTLSVPLEASSDIAERWGDIK
jgi:DNA polymerase-1